MIDLVEFIRIWQDALNSCAGIFLHCHSALNLNCFLLPLSLLSPESFWDSNAFETDTDLPSGWMRVRDTSGTYYWHIPTGTTQWEPPSPLGKVGSSMMSSSMSLETTPCEEPEVRFATLVRLRSRRKSKGTQTLIWTVQLSRNHGLNSLAPMKAPVKGNCGG